MHKRTLSLVALVLCFSTCTWAAVQQIQVQELGAANSLLLSGPGLVMGSSINAVESNNSQQALTANGRVLALQVENAALVQVAAGTGSGGTYGIDQTGLGVGVQNQDQPGGEVMGDQNQSQTVGMDTQVAAAGGDAFLGTMQGYVGSQVQLMMTPYSMSLNVSPVTIVDTGFVHRTGAGVGSGAM